MSWYLDDGFMLIQLLKFKRLTIDLHYHNDDAIIGYTAAFRIRRLACSLVEQIT